jgi:hypothetical protein
MGHVENNRATVASMGKEKTAALLYARSSLTYGKKNRHRKTRELVMPGTASLQGAESGIGGDKVVSQAASDLEARSVTSGLRVGETSCGQDHPVCEKVLAGFKDDRFRLVLPGDEVDNVDLRLHADACSFSRGKQSISNLFPLLRTGIDLTGLLFLDEVYTYGVFQEGAYFFNGPGKKDLAQSMGGGVGCVQSGGNFARQKIATPSSGEEDFLSRRIHAIQKENVASTPCRVVGGR